MSKLSISQLWGDTMSLYEEYCSEDKSIYADLFSNYVGKIDGYIVISRPLPKLSWCIHDIILVLDCYPSKIETFFYSVFDMELYSAQLRDDSTIRQFTKLCFYIRDNIPHYSPDITL